MEDRGDKVFFEGSKDKTNALFVSDMHGDIPENNYYFQFPIDVIFFLGDNGEVAVNQVLEALPGIPAFGVAGNHDYDNTYGNSRALDIHGQIVEVNGMNFGGIGGCIRYKGTDSRWLLTEEEAAGVLGKVSGADFIISHSPPARRIGGGKGYNACHDEGCQYPDPHRGFIELGRFLDRHSPKAVFHGHLHKTYSYMHGNTLVKGVYGIELVCFEKIFGQLAVYYTDCKIFEPVLVGSGKERG